MQVLPRDPREQPVHHVPSAALPPSHLFREGSGPSAQIARLAQRQERAKALGGIYRHDPVVFDRLFLHLHQDDPLLVEELRGKAYARAAVLLHREKA